MALFKDDNFTGFIFAWGNRPICSILNFSINSRVAKVFEKFKGTELLSFGNLHFAAAVESKPDNILIPVNSFTTQSFVKKKEIFMIVNNIILPFRIFPSAIWKTKKNLQQQKRENDFLWTIFFLLLWC